ncbi:BsaWI family type II restriction enzyme [Brachyspira innocens]|uniref:BsaWI family type II restriction enzyme n=1 Tax=Brachyspira innocens TaxID=13264 RepID=A0ABT8YW40_9SPIR|nr:BsaWI family type II restriction enzyme [Brachyspira innocens]MDO6993166.1 BsaWI family type II restriction enzyme [Brachyspira innocens]MDO7020123.1 BsaWI family type II restriction enzyme [Brachyspira innocens]
MINKEELKEIQEIESKYYMIPLIKRLSNYAINNNWILAFNYLYNVIVDSKEDVEILIENRIKNNEIKDKSQARKSIAGNAFQSILIYTFLKCKENNLIRDDIFITSKKNKLDFLNDLYTIKVGEETQKPDCDIVIYKLDKTNNLQSCLILSLKTSLRERAGQTYKWKLLMEIAIDDSNKIKDKYELEYNPKVKPYVGFVTVNFYNEINNPQQRGMFKFFDKAFIAKQLDNYSFISPLSSIVDFLNKDF